MICGTILAAALAALQVQAGAWKMFDRRLGMFVHWGIYSVGEWHEQEHWRRKMSRADYEKFARRFTAENFNADSFVDVAQSAGAEYIVITAKHHDGFCLFHTEYTDYITNQLSLCKLGIIYYDYAGDWAVPFAQQVWKQVGGQGSSTPLFIAGNNSHADEQQLKVLKKIMPFSINEKRIIPLEIKIYYDKITGKNE